MVDIVIPFRKMSTKTDQAQGYVSSRGVHVDISSQLDNAVKKTTQYPP